jgi:uncharacterized protein (DUF2141 family)
MKRLLILLTFICSLHHIVFGQNTLKIHIKNIELIKGEIMLRIAANKEDFENGVLSEEVLRREKVVASEMDIEISNLPNGVYAFAIYQDLNENGQLDTKKFGIPAEPFAFSRDALGKFGPPPFSQASFELKGGGVHREEVRMIYHKPKRKDKNGE